MPMIESVPVVRRAPGLTGRLRVLRGELAAWRSAMAASHRAASTDARRRRAFKRSLPVTEAQLWFWRVLLCGLAMVWMLAMGAMS